ncbi:MAG: hypothetical protein JNL97_08085, partial [Verrucomicrobiales bacterium]|nr:hypothetical protein [Verrucomicrobiales bacterium]
MRTVSDSGPVGRQDCKQPRRASGRGPFGGLGRGAWWIALTSLALVGPVEGAVVRRETLALEGRPAPGGAEGETFGSLSHVRARVNASGEVVFVAPIRGVRPAGETVDGLFVHSQRGLTRLAQEDGRVPGTDGLLFGRLSRAAINDDGGLLVASERPE